MTLFLTVSDVDPTIIIQVFSAERSVEVWTSLLPCLSSLPAMEIGALLSPLDLAVEKMSYYATPLKSKRPRLGQSSRNDTSFLAPPIIDPTVDILSLQPETFLPLFDSLCKRVASLQAASETLRVDSVTSRQQLILHQQTFGGELTLLQDRFGCDPGLTEVPLRSSWKGISFLHSLVMNSLQPNVFSPLLQQQIIKLLQQSLSPTLATIQALQQQVVALEQVLLRLLPSLSQLYNIWSPQYVRKTHNRRAYWIITQTKVINIVYHKNVNKI